MFKKTNLLVALYNIRRTRIGEDTLLAEVERIFLQNQRDRAEITNRIASSALMEPSQLNIALIDPEKIYYISDIKDICITYRLRFLDAHYFKKKIPEEAISKIRQLEKLHHTTINAFKIVAPARLLQLENADDPLLFIPLGYDYYYLIHKWGTDLHPIRKWLVWPLKNFENLVFTIFIACIVLTALTPLHLFTHGDVTPQEYLLFFLFMFKAVGGMVLFYGIAKGKNFNKAIWNSTYYNA